MSDEEVFEVDLHELTKEDFLTQPYKYLIIADTKFNRHKMTSILQNIRWDYGNVITNSELIIDYYLNENYTTFYSPERVFKRFSKLMIKRCFSSYSYILIDNYTTSKQQILDFENYINNAGNMMLFWIDPEAKNLISNLHFDIIIITTLDEMKSIKDIYDLYVKNTTFEDFVDIIRSILEEKYWFALKVHKARMMYIDVEEIV